VKEHFDYISNESATIITRKYSTSFSIAVRLLAPSIRQGIYNIYGFVRVADEIVDSFQDFPKEELLNRFEEEYNYALRVGISTNPVINAFQRTVVKYNVDNELVEAFLKSMRADLTKTLYANKGELEDYIYGSADVVGLMCLKVFVNGNDDEYRRLKNPAMKLGSAFQKVNFLRDLKQDSEELQRAYFPNINADNLSEKEKNEIVAEIRQDFETALIGIKKLPKEARFGVFVAYKYYTELLNKIEKSSAKRLKETRISVSNYSKTFLLFQSFFNYKFKIV